MYTLFTPSTAKACVASEVCTGTKESILNGILNIHVLLKAQIRGGIMFHVYALFPFVSFMFLLLYFCRSIYFNLCLSGITDQVFITAVLAAVEKICSCATSVRSSTCKPSQCFQCCVHSNCAFCNWGALVRRWNWTLLIWSEISGKTWLKCWKIIYIKWYLIKGQSAAFYWFSNAFYFWLHCTIYNVQKPHKHLYISLLQVYYMYITHA